MEFVTMPIRSWAEIGLHERLYFREGLLRDLYLFILEKKCPNKMWKNNFKWGMVVENNKFIASAVYGLLYDYIELSLNEFSSRELTNNAAWVFVKSKYRRRGIATNLLKHILKDNVNTELTDVDFSDHNRLCFWKKALEDIKSSSDIKVSDNLLSNINYFYLNKTRK